MSEPTDSSQSPAAAYAPRPHRLAWALMLAKAELRQAQQAAYRANRRAKVCKSKVDALKERMQLKERQPRPAAPEVQ